MFNIYFKTKTQKIINKRNMIVLSSESAVFDNNRNDDPVFGPDLLFNNGLDTYDKTDCYLQQINQLI